MYKRHSTSDADVQLIREFQLRQIIYNKAAPHFKNKYLTDNAWDEIAAKVGGDGEWFFFLSFVSILSVSYSFFYSAWLRKKSKFIR